MPGQLPAIACDRVRPQLRLAVLQPLRRKLVERRLLFDLRRRRRLLRPPDPALDVSEDMAKLGLRPLAAPTVVRHSKGEEVALPVGAKTDRPAPLLPVRSDH